MSNEKRTGELTTGGETKHSEAFADDELKRFIDVNALLIDEDDMDKDDRKQWRKQRRVFLNAVMKKELVIATDGAATFTPSASPGEPASIVFREPKGGSIKAVDGKGDYKDAAKTFALLERVTGVPEKRFDSMLKRDADVCSMLLTLFFG